MTNLIKICGLATPETLETALDFGADLVGFVRFPKSPRHVSLETGRNLSALARGRARRVVLLVDPTDEDVEETIAAFEPDFLQLHGSETPERVGRMRTLGGLPVIKALGIASASDLSRASEYADAADLLLLDAKPPRIAGALPGGNGMSFDWTLLSALDPALPFMLSGGLDSKNVAQAIRLTGAQAVDVSSGVETAPGRKDPARIRAFVRAARAAFAVPAI